MVSRLRLHSRNTKTKARRGNNNTDSRNGTSVVLGILSTAFGSVLIVQAGIALAHLCAFVLQPACVHELKFKTYAAAVSQIIAPSTSALFDTSTSKKSNVLLRKPVEGTESRPVLIIGATTGTKTSTQTGATLGFSSYGSEFPETAKFPPVCTLEQLGILKMQLPSEKCQENAEKPFRPNPCSFSDATTCGTANPHWFYDFVHQSSSGNGIDADVDDTFRGIIVGCNKGYEAVEMLRIASPSLRSFGSSNKYDLKKWKEEFSKVDADANIDGSVDCPADGKASSNASDGRMQRARVYCIEGMPTTFAQLEKTKAALGYSNDELDLSNFVVGSEHDEDGIWVRIRDKPIGAMNVGYYRRKRWCKVAANNDECALVPFTSIDHWIDHLKPSLKGGTTESVTTTKTATTTITTTIADPPIHILSISAETSDYDILRGAVQTLKRIQYIDFAYDFDGRWSKFSFSDLIFRLKKKGFVCYFTGSNGRDMWRITDCWQEHYELKFSSTVGCVNSNIPAAEPLLEKMEAMFLETLSQQKIRKE
mmetsp:Transcript_26465/g.57988  ORF Transcript_26465/g.57988 Transcript_26465/m.57988 type:complete len:536 (-) Transcript_26465:289-1896(-)|eukprot:CAMPEP_0168165348 /NCGR_PEP_ID=MMETSP0139_2-20121125/1441_1 /TAXON_ID=44445 /ORGANISM="Pseudo-nitzschia australis, Strain 10249 10 AB" /LENGTH=535 /DNA_ID=CAMNT_0008082463 /DNA_START=221 /DNA_END=1828 /DNA_ORIENTATION=+